MADVPAPDPDYVRRERERLVRPRPPRDRVKVGGQISDLVLDDERCDRKFEKEEAERRRDAFVLDREQRHRDRLQTRARQTLGDRLDAVLHRLRETDGGMRARPVGATRPSTDEEPGGKMPPQVSARGREVEAKRALIAHHLAALEQILDAEDGLLRVEPVSEGFFRGFAGHAGGPDTARMMKTEDRDRVVFDDFQGVKSADVAREAAYLGSSARTIERARANEAKRRKVQVRPVDGVILGEQRRAA